MGRKPGGLVGITSGGNWIVDRIKTCDCLPQRGMLASIRAQKVSTGGSPANVLADLARLKAPFPLEGLGLVGDDGDGRYVLEVFEKLGVDVSKVAVTKKAPTSYTDVMTDGQTGDRTFYHCRGANALFGPEHIPYSGLTCRIFHLGYLLLLDRMDGRDRACGTVAAAVLKKIRALGIKTSIDVVSEESQRFRTIVPPALRHVDYLIINEIEAERIAGRKIRRGGGKVDGRELEAAVDDIHAMGSMELVAVHMAGGVYMKDSKGKSHAMGSLILPDGYIKSAVGAGDAFCAGLLYGLHEGWEYSECAELGTCCAAASLGHAGASEGVNTLGKVLELGRRLRHRPPIL